MPAPSLCRLILLKNPRFLAAARGFGFDIFVEIVVLFVVEDEVVAIGGGGGRILAVELCSETSFIVINGIGDGLEDVSGSPFFPLSADLIYILFCLWYENACYFMV